MIQKILLLISFILLSNSLLAQVKEKEEYSKKELQTFLKIYKHTLDAPFDPVISMQKNTSKIKITEERLTQILQAQFAGNTVSLTDEEIIEMDKLKQMMELDKQAYNKALEEYIISQKMAPSKYEEIEKLYHSNTKFQKKVTKLYHN
jgi:light-regulated signal transduction histidine kinase (bacteriophytochrome)